MPHNRWFAAVSHWKTLRLRPGAWWSLIGPGVPIFLPWLARGLGYLCGQPQYMYIYIYMHIVPLSTRAANWTSGVGCSEELASAKLGGWLSKTIKKWRRVGAFWEGLEWKCAIASTSTPKTCFVQNWNSPDPNFYSVHITQVMPGEMRQCKIRSSLERINRSEGCFRDQANG